MIFNKLYCIFSRILDVGQLVLIKAMPSHGQILVLIFCFLNLLNMTESQFWEITEQEESGSSEHWLPSNFYSKINHQYLLYYRRGEIYLLRNYVFEKAKYD
ncbi:hypothetical protein FF38_09422 [Lucilia cuprina]|uniref:Uncharacterized protein n=1 Tax=Lucilia cuprina TaxID=7375 RepID=A0A0L0C8V0_LUCCU|nr:hypothetical protein FF38_09422 [Lucilia cuprina]